MLREVKKKPQTIKERVKAKHGINLSGVRDRREEKAKGTILLNPFCAVCSKGIKDDFMLVHVNGNNSHLNCLLLADEIVEVHKILEINAKKVEKEQSKRKIKTDLLKQ